MNWIIEAEREAREERWLREDGYACEFCDTVALHKLDIGVCEDCPRLVCSGCAVKPYGKGDISLCPECAKTFRAEE